MTDSTANATRSKPCACGQPNCFVIQHPGEPPSKFKIRIYANTDCADRHRVRRKPSRGKRKPCACGRDDCTVVQRDEEKPSCFRRRRFASLSCSTWYQNMNNPKVIEGRSKGGKATGGQNGKIASEERAGALVTHSAWLERPCGRIAAQRQAQGIAL